MGTIGRSSCARWGRITCVLWQALIAGCGEPSPSLDGNPSPTWLSVCASDVDCGPDARCLGGICTPACDASELDVCGAVNADAACDTVLGACVVPCVVSMACQVLGSGYVCEEGRCRARLSP